MTLKDWDRHYTCMEKKKNSLNITNNNIYFDYHLNRLCTSAQTSRVERGRYLDRDQRLCDTCSLGINEDEKHFLL